jgi:hypothetical protein
VTTMLHFPIDVLRVSNDVFQAAWVDFPNVPAATGDDPSSALASLMSDSLADVTDLVASGKGASPSASNGRPVISIGAPMTLKPHYIKHLLGVTPNGTAMVNYSWTNDFAYFE